MTNKSPIATPVGIFMAGYSGAGGDYIPLRSITRDIFQRLPNGVVFGLKIETGVTAPTNDSMIIDVIFDGEKASTLQDPHIVEQVTDYPIDVATRGLTWFGVAPVPRYTQFSTYGMHSVQVKVAPRVAPPAGVAGATAVLPPRDFSTEAGGRIAEFTFEIRKGPVALSPEQQMDD